MEKPRGPAEEVWITGLGAVTAFGIGVDPFFEGCRRGQVATSPVERFETGDLNCHVGGTVPGDWPLFRETELSTRAAREALEDARLTAGSDRGEVWLGVLQPDADPLEQGLPCPGHAAPDRIAGIAGFGGFSTSVATACSAAGISIALAAERIRAGLCDVALAGGVAGLFRAAFAGLCQMGGMADEVCRPFDAQRTGVIIGEGAGFVTLESPAHARARKARPYARIAGAGISCDATHPLAMDRSGKGVRRALREAVESSGREAGSIGLVVAHGTGTRLNDSTETESIREIYGPGPEVVSLKPPIGHTMSASAALSVVLLCRMFRDRIRLGTTTLRDPDPELPRLSFPRDAAPWEPRLSAVHAFGFGGQNVALLLEPVP
ncbi:MAG: beta-ketoacyl-[acyl-carrier-protein] synthase family protein [Thermoanaerobaculia bacterium]